MWASQHWTIGLQETNTMRLDHCRLIQCRWNTWAAHRNRRFYLASGKRQEVIPKPHGLKMASISTGRCMCDGPWMAGRSLTFLGTTSHDSTTAGPILHRGAVHISHVTSFIPPHDDIHFCLKSQDRPVFTWVNNRVDWGNDCIHELSRPLSLHCLFCRALTTV